MKERIVVVCPGRGSYTKETLGYLKPYASSLSSFIKDIDERRRAWQEPSISELDGAETFQTSLHTKGEHASPLIYACSYADFQSIDLNRYEIVAVTGNSMGWYLTLAFGGALDWAGAFEIIQTMGSMMKEGRVGGQIIYPVVNGDWQMSAEMEALIAQTTEAALREEGSEVYPSIYLGGYRVLGGNTKGLNYMLKHLPKIESYPFQLVNHAAFHTPMLQDTSEKAFEKLSLKLFQKPRLSMIDGRGKIWHPYSADLEDLYNYTLGHQVVCPYDFTKAITVAIKEFAPDKLVLLGPGNSLGGAIGQILIQNKWQGITSKSDFTTRQKQAPFLISMGLSEQKRLLQA